MIMLLTRNGKIKFEKLRIPRASQWNKQYVISNAFLCALLEYNKFERKAIFAPLSLYWYLFTLGEDMPFSQFSYY